jgi:hypothetical protein
MRIYLAGPMRGYPEDNFPAFMQAAGALRELGHFVMCPAEHDIGDSSPDGLRMNLAMDTTWICLVAQGVVLMPGWRDSLGAQAEAALARRLEIPCWELAGFLRDGAAARTVHQGDGEGS